MTAALAPLPERTEPLVPGCVDNYLVTDVPLCGPDMPMSELHAMLVGRPYESTADVAVCALDDAAAHRLLGLIPLEKVLAADPTQLARDLMDDPPVVPPGLNQEEAAWRAAHHGESSLAVVDSRRCLPWPGAAGPPADGDAHRARPGLGPPGWLPDLGGVGASRHGRTDQGPALAPAAVADARPCSGRPVRPCWSGVSRRI